MAAWAVTAVADSEQLFDVTGMRVEPCGSRKRFRFHAEWAPTALRISSSDSRRRGSLARDIVYEADDQLSADLLHEESLSTGHTFPVETFFFKVT